MLNLYCVFHLNLAYSSVEDKQRPDIIERCYWPLTHLIRDLGLPIGIEASGYTLEVASMLDPAWISALKKSLEHGEFVGSGYAQIIGPLIPAEMNRWNQGIGIKTYEKLLGSRPKVALVNEMAYASGVVSSYLESGYQAIIMEWNNPRKYHPEWEGDWRYFPQRALGNTGREIPLIWADSIAFQKFQRYVHGELELKEYIEFLYAHDHGHGYFPLYVNDVEIFDFRPGRYKSEAKPSHSREWDRIIALFEELKTRAEFRFVAPSAVLQGLADAHGGNRLRLESPDQPIPVKKQEKYNINRWALTGRDDLGCNTACYQIYAGFKHGQPTEDDWKELCYLWSSDFRTHITQKRWDAYCTRLKTSKEIWHPKTSTLKSHGETLKTPYRDLAAIIEEDERLLTIDGEMLKCVFNKRKGLTISALTFKAVSPEPLIGTLPHGYFEDIAWAADFFSGHTIIETPGEHKTTDLEPCTPDIAKEGACIVIGTEIRHAGVVFSRKYRLDLVKGIMRVHLDIFLPARVLALIHILNLTFIPTAFEKESLFFSTHLGGRELETFAVGGGEIHHARTLSALISATQGLGNTEGIVSVGDSKKRLVFQLDQSLAALIAHVHYSPIHADRYFLRLSYSAQEMDETFRENPAPYLIRCGLQIHGEAHAKKRQGERP
jgi:hypothetical protein